MRNFGRSHLPKQSNIPLKTWFKYSVIVGALLVASVAQEGMIRVLEERENSQEDKQ